MFWEGSDDDGEDDDDDDDDIIVRQHRSCFNMVQFHLHTKLMITTNTTNEMQIRMPNSA
jgi:hypothetical protein